MTSQRQRGLSIPATTAAMKNILMLGLTLVLMTPITTRAGDQTSTAATDLEPSLVAATANTRFGLFDGLDSRSSYGEGGFPEPFIVDDSVLEVNEARLDWLHAAGEGNQHGDTVAAEVEKGFGQLTLEVKAPLERESSSGQISTNFGNVEL